MLRVVIVDDEEPARMALRVLLSERADVEIVAECRDGLEAVEAIRWLPIDLLLLDVQMPGLDGFQVVQSIGAGRMPPTIFVTAFDHYALRAFDVQAIDYVLKPFDRVRLFAAIDRARQRIAERHSAEWARQVLQVTRDRPTPPPIAFGSRLPVPDGNRLIFVPFDDIEWIEANDQYVTLHASAKPIEFRQTLQMLLTRLPARSFVQIHRSHAVNVTKVKEVILLGKGDGLARLNSGLELRISRRYRDRLREQTGWPL